MGEYMRKKKIGEVAVTEVSSSVSSSKRRKVDDSRENFQLEIQNQCSSAVDLSEQGGSISPAMSGTSDHVRLSFCSSNDSREVVKDCLKTLDLKGESFETDNSMFINGGFSRETTPSSELCADLEEMESSSTSKKKPAPPASSRRKLSASKIPSAAEIEDFFSVAEQYEQKRFADKYNYDVVKDAPMEGRYQWVRLKP